jgi:WD40 repeat protein
VFKNRRHEPCDAVSDEAFDFTGVQFLQQRRGEQTTLVLSLADGRLCTVPLKDLMLFRQSKTLSGSMNSTNSTRLQKNLGSYCPESLKIASGGQGELVMSADDAWIGLAGTDGLLHLWERHGNTLRKAMASPIRVSAGPIQHLTFSPAGDPKRRILSAFSLDGTVSLWSSTGQQLARFRKIGKDRQGVMGAEFDTTGTTLLLWKRDGSLRKEPVQDIPSLIHRGCDWLRRHREGQSEINKADNKALGFCDSLTKS